jgi:hypothetical protein
MPISLVGTLLAEICHDKNTMANETGQLDFRLPGFN